MLALARERRLARWPDLPTLRESGFAVETPMESLGFFLPAGTPDQKLAALQAAVRAATRTPAVRAAMELVGMSPMTIVEDGYAVTIARERAAWLAPVTPRNFAG